MGRRLKDIERERAQEESKARAWAEREGIGQVPGRRLENGESATHARSAWLSGYDQAGGTENEPGTSRSITSYDQFETVDDWEEGQVHKQAGRATGGYLGEDGLPADRAGLGDAGARLTGVYTPLVGRGGISLAQEELRDVVEWVLTYLLPVHRDLLRMRYEERMTLEAMAEEFRCSHVNIIKRLRVAEQNFRKAFGEHAKEGSW